jgi:hypothetical protein
MTAHHKVAFNKALMRKELAVFMAKQPELLLLWKRVTPATTGPGDLSLLGIRSNYCLLSMFPLLSGVTKVIITMPWPLPKRHYDPISLQYPLNLNSSKLSKVCIDCENDTLRTVPGLSIKPEGY